MDDELVVSVVNWKRRPGRAYERYIGDAAVPGKGELLIWKPRAS